ncbi:F0F1 ATP synthase subunit epsilon [Acetohalobium arabaticum]|uniref:ATP synthase epsilon chain n=1 Tax=Acetohalobium arabaticum (strain ATCC 49924 / DSM 5501 / Z-7288) TaxID=574087 RepID=D9QTY0_ACEAZ|nr:F0F1 ATP synthase subunit epsilon [Acetohalobium arabaticum]ADL13701.1 ATP synthase F1, epsilon subunit [Acetohalobium arabaticum DSM 5501]
MANTVQVDILTSERTVYSDEVEMVIVPTIDGNLGFLPNHSPLITGLQIGQIRIKKDGEEIELATSGGFIEVKPDQINILADTAEFPEEIDIERAKRAKKRAKERLQKSDEARINETRAESALQRAINRIDVVQGE